jgi:signal transduction histidine kinase
VDRLNRLVQHLLDTTRLRLDGREGQLQRFDLAALADEVIERMRASAPAHDITVSSVAVPVHADRDRIARVITSLVDNAVRFSPRGGPVCAQVDARDGEAIFSIEDHGLGIPEERQARIFERFYRAHAGTPQDYGGLGLGLDMSREIVARHGGRMWFESTPGNGSTFHFSVPLTEEPP